MTAGRNSYSPSPIEYYAQEVYARTAEIDDAFGGMAIALEYLQRKDHPDSKYQFSSHHAFHAENFLLRLTTVVDRSFLLAGTSMLMEGTEIERIGSKGKILHKASAISPPSGDILKDMEKAITALKKTRNQVAHQAGYSSKNLGVLKAIEIARMDSRPIDEITDIVPYDEMKDIVIAESVEPFTSTKAALNDLVKDLIDSFAFAYSGLLKKHGGATASPLPR